MRGGLGWVGEWGLGEGEGWLRGYGWGARWVEVGGAGGMGVGEGGVEIDLEEGWGVRGEAGG